MRELKQKAQHRWDDILRNLGVDDKIISGKHQSCPVCESGKDCFRYSNYQGHGMYFCNLCGSGDGFNLLQGIFGFGPGDACLKVESVIGKSSAQPQMQSNVGNAKKRILDIWKAGKKIEHSNTVGQYFEKRGIDVDLSSLCNLKFHNSMEYWGTSDDGKASLIGKYPAMIGLIRSDEFKPATLHVTYLADVPIRKKILPPFRSWQGGAIHLTKTAKDQPLCIAEGIESALSVKTLHPEFSVWACVSASNMTLMKPNSAITNTLYIAGDNDRSFTGQAAMFTLARALSAKKFNVTAFMPHKKGSDFNDILNADISDAAIDRYNNHE